MNANPCYNKITCNGNRPKTLKSRYKYRKILYSYHFLKTMNEKLYTVAVLKTQPGKSDEMVAVLEELAKHTRQEPGALQYGFYRNQEDPNIILSFEEWQHADHESAHWETPHLTSAIEKFKDILDGEPIIYKTRQII